ncbi:MAG: phosphate/phosphite/phosphonate ABC transporter substrate-binding protein [Ectothiorhodospiraceae bacterium]|nr:phosphate/phosphite/phosphonate ABC transporter substrate-binding protein [Ectothiorhodospiraceae bacterium]
MRACWPAAVAAVVLLLGTVASRAEVYTFGVVPQQAASKLARLWTPILQRLGREVGHEIAFATAPDIPTFEARLAAGEYDIAYMNPYHYTVFHATTGYEALARARDKRIRGIVVVRADSPITTISELDGATVAFPAPAAFAASVLPRAEFAARGIGIVPRYVSSHDSVYRAVAKGLFPAGGGVVRTLDGVDPDVRGELRILWTTAGYTPHAIATHPRLASAVRDRVRDALTGLDADDAGRALVTALSIVGFDAASDSDWDDVRALGITELQALVASP